MDKDLLLLIKNIRQAKDLDDLERLQDLSGTVLRSQKREAIISLLAISEELGKDEILVSLEDLTRYLRELLSKEEQARDNLDES
mgnify:CR=1 FL=1